MIGRMHRLKTVIVTITIILTAFFAMATHIDRDDVVACAGDDQEVDVGVPVQFDGTCSTGVGSLTYTWFFGDGETGSGPTPEHTYQSNAPGTSAAVEGVYHATLVVKDSNNVYDLDTVRINVHNHYPTADAGSDRIVHEDQSVYLDTIGSSDVDDDIVSTQWDFGDGTHMEVDLDSITEHIYEKAGTYPVTLTITDNDGAFDKDTVFVSVENMVPIARGLANGKFNDTLTVYEDDAVEFDASMSTDTRSDMPLLRYAWDFGDGSGGYGLITTHSYTKRGTYQATLSVTDDDDASTQHTITVNVLNAAPVAVAGPDQIVNEGNTVFFDATGSSDTPSDEPILDYSWSFGAKGTNPTYNWYDDSMNNVDLLVKDDDGVEDRDSTNIKVENVPPVASIDGAYVLVDFTLRAAGEKWHDVRLKVAESGWEIPIMEVVRTPGSPNDQSVTAEDMHITIAEPVSAVVHYTPEDDPVNGSPNGATPVWLTLTLEDGTSTKLRRTFNVQKPEEWVWIIDMNTLIIGQPIHFEGSIYDPGTDDIRVKWDFGDGTSPIITDYASNCAHPMRITEHVVRSFAHGQYTVSLEAVDDDGGMGAMSITVTNTDMLTSTNIAPRASSSGGSTVLEDEELTLVGVGSDTGSDQETLTYTWDFGDGTTAHDPIVTHAYAKEGTYYATLVVADDSGEIGITSELVEVQNVIPTAVADASQVTVVEDDVIGFDASSSSDTPTDLALIQYAWDFGDGSKGFGMVINHVYTRYGRYQVTLTVTDDNGARTTDMMAIDVQNLIPFQATITAEETADEDELILFKGVAIDTLSDVPLLTHSWLFGDGSTGTGTNPTHAYSSPGTYSVVLTVTDDDLAITEAVVDITVSNVAPVAYGGLSKNLYGPQMLVSFEGRGFDTPTDQPSLSFTWDFGDGASGSGPLFTHQYPTVLSRTYTASLTVVDMHGSSDVVLITISVKVDSDGDQLLDGEEYNLGTDPFNFDTDGDWIIDYYEVNPPWGKPVTDPKRADMDNDGCSDWEEIWPGADGYLTDPVNPDTDGDGLTDCSEVYAKKFKTEKRYQIGPGEIAPGILIPGFGTREVRLVGVTTYSPASSIITAEAKIGISHTWVGELKITIENWMGSAGNPQDKKSITIRDSEGGSAHNIFASYDLLSAGFLASDLSERRTWALIVDDQVPLVGMGFIEYFEIYVMTRMDPTDRDTDNDGLSDGEEATLGDDGWFTDPWRVDTDADGIKDSWEVQGWKRTAANYIYPSSDGFKTDPTKKDTDGDGVNEEDDWDPLNDLMIRLELQTITDLAECSPEDMFFEVVIYDLQKTIFTQHRDMPDRCNVPWNYHREYTFDIPDTLRSPSIGLALWEDSTGGDELWDIHPESGYSGVIVNHDILRDSTEFFVTGDEDGDPNKHDAEVTFRIVTVRPPRVNTILLSLTDTESLYTAADGSLRYVGEQEFYLVLLFVVGISNEFTLGYNSIVVPRTVFVDSNLGQQFLGNIPLEPKYSLKIQFSSYNIGSVSTINSIAGTLAWGSITDLVPVVWANKVLWDLTHDKDGSVIAESRVVTDQLVTMNLDRNLLKFIPVAGIIFDPLGEDPDDWWGEAAWEGLTDLLEAIGSFFLDLLLTIIDILVELITFVIEFGLWVIGIIISVLEAVIKAVIFVATKILDFVEGLVTWVLDLLLNKILPLIKDIVMFSLKVIGGPVFELIGEELVDKMFDFADSVLSWVANDFVPGVFDMVGKAIELGIPTLKIVGGFATCVGDLTIDMIGDAANGNCRALLDAAKQFGRTATDILSEALKIGGSALVTAITIALDWCKITPDGLGSDEKDMARDIFGNSIDLDEVEIVREGLCSEIEGLILGLGDGEPRPFVTGYIINIPDGAEWNNAILVHELTHVWQYEHRGIDYTVDSIVKQWEEDDPYNYGYDNEYDGSGAEPELELAEGILGLFNVEQQAMIIQHYFVRRYIEQKSPADYAAWQPYADIVYEEP